MQFSANTEYPQKCFRCVAALEMGLEVLLLLVKGVGSEQPVVSEKGRGEVFLCFSVDR